MAALALSQRNSEGNPRRPLTEILRVRWIRVLATALAIAAAGLLAEAPPVVVSILPAPVDMIGAVILTQIVNTLFQGLLIALCLETFWLIQSKKLPISVQILLGAILLVLPAVLSPLSLQLPISYDAVYQEGLSGSREELGFHLVWQGGVLTVIAAVYLIRRRHVFEQQMRGESVAREWQDANRAILESRLQAIQVRVEPQLLFDSLAAMRQLYGEDLVDGEAVLDALIDFLRRGLPRTKVATSSVGFEIDLLKSFVELQRLARLAKPVLSVEMPAEASERAMAAGVLQPLIAAWLEQCGPATLAAFEVEVQSTADQTDISVIGPKVDLSAYLAKAELNLRGSHDRARVSSRTFAGKLECKLEYPNDIDQIQSA
jgi:hypothetical protein